jgi:hypothetical protein
MNPAPPAALQWLLECLLPIESDQSVSGDLIELYRDQVDRAHAEAPANRWYAGQVAQLLWRWTGLFVVLVAAAHVIRTAFDTFSPVVPGPHAWQFRSALTTWSAIVIYLTAGLYGGARTGKTSAGMVTALTAHVLGTLIATAVDLVLFAAVINRSTFARDQWYATGGWGEAFGLPLILCPIVAMLGFIGGACASQWRAWRDARHASS